MHNRYVGTYDNFPFRVSNPPPEFYTVLYEFYSIFKLEMSYGFLLAILLQGASRLAKNL